LLAGPPGDALRDVDSSASNSVSKLVFADCTNAAKKAWSVCNKVEPAVFNNLLSACILKHKFDINALIRGT
jgi:hypothetical protein